MRIARAFAGRPVWLAASTHPGEEEIVLAAHAQRPPRAADAGADPGAAASGARRRAGRDAARRAACRWRSARRARRSAPTPTSISPTRSARWGSGTASPRSASSAARWSTSAGTIPSSRRCSAAPSSRAARAQLHRRLPAAGGAPTPRCWCATRPSSPRRWSRRMAPDRAAAMAAAAWEALQRGRRGHRHGARRRSAACLDRQAPDAARPRFWGNPPARPGLAARLLAPLAALWAWAARRRLARGAGGAARRAGDLRRQPDRRRRRQDPDGDRARRAAARRAGVAVHVVSRGHGGSLAGPVRVDEGRHARGRGRRRAAAARRLRAGLGRPRPRRRRRAPRWRRARRRW